MTIQPAKITMPVAEARHLYRKYKEHRHYSAPVDREIQRAYQLIAQGKMVIRLTESIRQAGVDSQGLPKLAVIRADATECFCHLRSNGGARFSMMRWVRDNNSGAYIDLPDGTFPARPPAVGWSAARTIPPMIPLHLRPKRALENYHILWEAEWSPIPPADPLLLRRIGKADLWLVVAAWDLTPVEQAALSTRLLG